MHRIRCRHTYSLPPVLSEKLEKTARSRYSYTVNDFHEAQLKDGSVFGFRFRLALI